MSYETYEGYAAIGRGAMESIKLVIFLAAIYYLFIIAQGIIIFSAYVFIGNPNIFIPIIFLLMIGLTWRISSSSSASSFDSVTGFFTIHALSFLVPCLAYYYIYTRLISSDLINSMVVYNQHAIQWIQSFDSLLYYGAWAGYILAFFLILTIFALPIYLSRKAGKYIIYNIYNKGFHLIGDTIFIAFILCISIFLIHAMDYYEAIEALQSFERNMIALFAVTLLTTIIGWRKFLQQESY